jgi:hypothetical protein
VTVVRCRRRTVVGGVRHLLVGLPAALLVVLVAPVVAAMEPVRDVPLGARRRVVAEEVPQQPPEPVHRKGL